VRETALQAENSVFRRVKHAGFGGALALALVLGAGLGAMAADDDEDSFETKLLKGFLGINDANITYRERSPLVVPPSRDLPPPVTESVASNPAWPKDADIKKRKPKADQRGSRGFEEDARPLLPDQLELGRKAGAGRGVGPVDDSGRRLTPAELGYKGNLFGSLFGKKNEEAVPYPGEPPRASMTDPPTGYLTPSPHHPYGLVERKEAPKPYKLEDRGTSLD
jgi:hypothetical protein